MIVSRKGSYTNVASMLYFNDNLKFLCEKHWMWNNKVLQRHFSL